MKHEIGPSGDAWAWGESRKILTMGANRSDGQEPPLRWFFRPLKNENRYKSTTYATGPFSAHFRRLTNS